MVSLAEVRAVAGVVQIAISHDDEPEVSRSASRVLQFSLKADAVAGKRRVDQQPVSALRRYQLTVLSLIPARRMGNCMGLTSAIS